MSRTIHVLSDIAINQIAAGEVVEGPASVVKELCENAIDAGADKVSVEIKGGGHFLIEVSDNGKGIEKDDVPLSIERFATSKIEGLEDLSRLVSMGFRGEALAAICSVSKFSILTSTGDVATLLETAGGKEIKLSQRSRNRGTTIRVESLFYNTPARKKFQKARGPSTTEIVKCITKLSLCHRSVAFHLIVDGKEVFTCEGGEEFRVEDVLGKDFFTPSIPVSFVGEGLKIEGIIASPEKVRSNRLGQYLIVNKRNVYSLLISNAVMSGFGSSIGKGDFPLFFLDLTFDPSKIDVNVHPQKKEIRFQEEEKVFSMVREAIASALTGSFEVPEERVEGRSFSRQPIETNTFRNFTYVEKKDVEEIERSIETRRFVQQMIEPEGCFNIKFLWDEFCFVEVIAPCKKFPSVQEREIILVDLSVLEYRLKKQELNFEGQSLITPEEVFLSHDEMGICSHHKEDLETLGIKFRLKDVSVEIEEMPSFLSKHLKEMFIYILHLLKSGEALIHIKEKVKFKALRTKRYSQDQARFLIERSEGSDFGSVLSKKELRGLCKEYTI